MIFNDVFKFFLKKNDFFNVFLLFFYDFSRHEKSLKNIEKHKIIIKNQKKT